MLPDPPPPWSSSAADLTPEGWRFYRRSRFWCVPKDIPKHIPPELYEVCGDPLRAMLLLPPQGREGGGRPVESLSLATAVGRGSPRVGDDHPVRPALSGDPLF